MAPVKSKMATRYAAQAAAAPAVPPHLIVEARAGSGKTTTLVEGLKAVKGLPTSITPSEQQKAVWDAMALSRDAKSVGFVAFNKSIADELGRRVPAGCEAMTMHSLGNRAVCARFGKVRLNEYKVSDTVARLMDMEPRTVRKEYPGLLPAVERLVGLCKMNLVGEDDNSDVVREHGRRAALAAVTAEQIRHLADAYGVSLEDVEEGGHLAMTLDLAARVLVEGADPERLPADGMNYDDMVWLPVVLDLPTRKFDLLLVDESQDLGRCQQELARKAGRRLVLCGDPKQAIYGFAGADSRAMGRMADRLKAEPNGCLVLPLTVTRRCGKAIVAEANRYVPDFHAHPSNPDGRVDRRLMGREVPKGRDYRELVQDGDMVLSRTNAVLVSEAFGFIRQGRKATIQGRDIAQGLISTVTRQKAETVPDLISRLGVWLRAEVEKEQAKRNPSEDKIQALEDRVDCLLIFCEEVTTGRVEDVIGKIEAVFTNDKNVKGIRLSSIHRAKGLEAHRVFLLEPKGKEVIPAWAEKRSAMEREQLEHLKYVAITRAVEALTYVTSAA